jgi:hypothetical protein
MQILTILGILLLIAFLARKARALAEDAAIPQALITVGLSLAVG